MRVITRSLGNKTAFSRRQFISRNTMQKAINSSKHYRLNDKFENTSPFKQLETSKWLFLLYHSPDKINFNTKVLKSAREKYEYGIPPPHGSTSADKQSTHIARLATRARWKCHALSNQLTVFVIGRSHEPAAQNPTCCEYHSNSSEVVPAGPFRVTQAVSNAGFPRIRNFLMHDRMLFYRRYNSNENTPRQRFER